MPVPFFIVRNDITKMRVDAVVNTANRSLLGGSGVDGSIHRAAGPGLLLECMELNGCAPGQAKITGGYNLPAKYVIHVVGPRWRGGAQGEEEQLVSCYRSALALALEHRCETVAFPLISAGRYGYPREAAMRVAAETIGAFLEDHEMTVYLVVFDRDSYQLSTRRFQNVQSYIDDHYAADNADKGPRDRQWRNLMLPRSGGVGGPPRSRPKSRRKEDKNDVPSTGFGGVFWERMPMAAAPPPPPSAGRTLEETLDQLDESFSQMLLRKIDEKGMTDAQCYKKANIDRKLFSKIRSDKGYKPSKPTVLAFAIALELSLPETKDMLQKAGFALSHSYKFDLIVEYFILNGNYNIYEINEALFAFDQSLLGA